MPEITEFGHKEAREVWEGGGQRGVGRRGWGREVGRSRVSHGTTLRCVI